MARLYMIQLNTPHVVWEAAFNCSGVILSVLALTTACSTPSKPNSNPMRTASGM